MNKPMRLDEVLGRFEKQISQAGNFAREIILRRANLHEMDAYASFMQSLLKYTESPGMDGEELVSKLNSARESFNLETQTTEETPRTKPKKDTEEKNLSYKGAVEKWQKRDEEAGREKVEEQSYRFRIRTHAQKGNLKTVRQNGRIVSINPESLDNLIEKFPYRALQQKLKRKNRRSLAQPKNFREWLTPKEAIDFYRVTEKLNDIKTEEVTDRNYRDRIARAVKKMKISVKDEGQYLNRDDLLGVIGTRIGLKSKTSVEKRKGVYKQLVDIVKNEGADINEVLDRLKIIGKQAQGYRMAYKRYSRRGN
ncbi:hypothetical protein HY450_02315 [Candidatus Pacearchaeota archaeon]|nr:hypothetical protein [Candidatus Pacearchaeota archaeon]